MTEGISPSGRPVKTVLETLRINIDYDRFDVAVFEIETVAADLGYGDVRALSASIAWVERLREESKQTAIVDGGVRGQAALDLAGIADRFDLVAPDAEAALDETDVAPERAVAVSATVEGIARARELGFYLAIAVARGGVSPEQLRRAGAHTVVAELHELL